jgi:hypothetical protein
MAMKDVLRYWPQFLRRSLGLDMQIERVENMEKNEDRLFRRCRIFLSFVARNGKTILPRDARAALKIDCGSPI